MNKESIEALCIKMKSYLSEQFQIPMIYCTISLDGKPQVIPQLGEEKERDFLECSKIIFENADYVYSEDVSQDGSFEKVSVFMQKHSLRFFMGILLKDASGEPLGTFCFADSQVKKLSEDQKKQFLFFSEVLVQFLVLSKNKLNLSKELLKAQNALLSMESSRVSTSGEMVSHILRDMSNPLSIIHFKALQLKSSFTLSENKNLAEISVLDTMISYSEKIFKILKNLSIFIGNKQENKIDSFWVGPFLEQVFSQVSPRLTATHVNFFIENVPHDLKVSCHGNLFSQVLIFFINHSCDSMASLDEKWMKLEIQKKENKVYFLFTDNAPKKTTQELNRIIHTLFSLKPFDEWSEDELVFSRKFMNQYLGDIYPDSECPQNRVVFELNLDVE